MATPSSTTAATLPGNLRFSAGGVYIDDLVGTFVKSVSEDELTGVVTVTVQLDDGSEDDIPLDGSLLINAAPDADPQPEADEDSFNDRRLWWDGVTLKRVSRILHTLQVSWPAYTAALYRGAHSSTPSNFLENEYYYHTSLHTFIFRVRIVGILRNIQGTPNGWRGHVRDQAEADSLVTGNNQIFEWGGAVYSSSGYVAPTNPTYAWGSLLINAVAPTWDSIEGKDAARPSENQIEVGTNDDPRPWAVEDVVDAIGEHERFTDVEQGVLDDLSRLIFPHPDDDWQIRQTYFVTDFFANRYSTFLSLGWDADNRLRALSGDGHVGRLGGHNRGRIYDGSETLRAGLISGVHWLYLRDHGANGSAIVRAPVDGGDSEPEFEITLRYFSMFADPDSGELIGLLRRISATEMEVGLLAYDDSANTITAEDTITLTLPVINNALGTDFVPLTDIHRESATGVYENVAGALLEGDTFYLLLTNLTKTDSHTVSVLIGWTLAGAPNNRTLTILAENAVDELPIQDELTSAILPLEADELFIARDTAAYRLAGHEESDITTDDTLSGEGTEDDPLAVAAPYPGPVTWPTLGDRPDRPTADEIIAGTGVDESVPSPSDVVALANAHARNARSNTAPESIAEAPAEGTAPEVSRGDHVHALPIDDTLEFDAVSGDLGVSIHDVVQHLQETIRYYTDSIDHPADPGGHSAGQMYRTGPFPTTISRVQSQIDVLFGHPSYAARIYTVDSDRNILEFLGESSHFVPLSNNPHSYDFTVDDGIGIPIPASSFIVILFHAVGGVLIPLRTGDEASDSPGESYQDANRDFNMVHSVVYDNVHPSVGDDTASHGDDDHIRGNIKIYYDIAYDHGNLLGGTKANTDLQNIDEDLTDDEKEVVRTRIGVGEGKVDTDLQNIDDDLTVAEQDAVATDVGVVREPRAWATATTFEAGWMATRNGNLYIAASTHVSAFATEPGTNGGSDEWFLVRQVGEIQHAAGRYYQPGMVVANGGSSQIFICRRPTTNEPSAMNDNWLWLPYGAYTLEAPTTTHRYRRGNLIFTGSEVVFCHTTPPSPGLTIAELLTSPLYITRLSTAALTQDEIEDTTSDAQGTVSGRGLARAGLRIPNPSHPDDQLHRLHSIPASDLFGNASREIVAIAYEDDDLYAISSDGYANDTQFYNGVSITGGAARNADFWFVSVTDNIVSIPVAGGANQTFDWNPLNSPGIYSVGLAVDVSSTTARLYQLQWLGGGSIVLVIYAVGANGSLTLEDTIELTLSTVNNALPSDYLDLSEFEVVTPSGLGGFGARAISIVGDTVNLYLAGVRRTSSLSISRTLVMPFALSGNAGVRSLAVDEMAIFDLPFDQALNGAIQLDDVAATLYLAGRHFVDQYSEHTTGIQFPIEDEGAIVVEMPSGLDFRGRVTVTEDTNGAARVDITAGSGELHPVDSVYQINEADDNVDSLADRRAGDIYFAGSRDFRIFEVRVPIRPDTQTDTYQCLIQPVAEISDTSYTAVGGPAQVSVNVIDGEIYGFNFPGGVLIGAGTFFAVMVENEQARPAQAFSTTGAVESFDPVHAFQFVAKASNDEVVFAAGSETFHRADFAVRMDIDFTVEVEDLFDLRDEGNHIISAPHFVDFRGANVEVVERSGGARIIIETPDDSVDEDKLTQAVRDSLGGGISLVVADSVTQPNSLIQGGLPRFRMNVNTPGTGEPTNGQILKFNFPGPFVNTVGAQTYSFDTFAVSLFLNNTNILTDDREGQFVYPDGRTVRGDDFPAGVDAYALKTPDAYVWLTSADLLGGIENTVDAADIDDTDEVAVIRHSVGQDPTRRLPIAGLRTVMTSDLDFANRSLDNIAFADKNARDEHRTTIGVTPPFKDFPFGSGELLGNVFVGLSNITGATAFRNSLYGVDAGFTPARLVRIDTSDPRNDNGPFGSLGDLPPGIDDPQALVDVGERLYVVNGNATNTGLWRVNPDDPGDTSGDFGRVGGFPAGLTNPRGAFPANGDIYIVQGNAAPDFDELWRINEFNPTSLANPLGLQYSLPSNITGAPTSGVWHDAYAYIVTGSGRQLFRVDPNNLSHGQFTTPDNRFGLVGELPIPNTETVTAVASLGGILYVFTGSQIWAKSVGNVELTRFKADADSPALTGTPTAPTPADDDDSTRIATTEFVVDRISSQQQQGNVQVGDDHWTHVYWTRSAAKPAAPAFGTWDGNSWSGSTGIWHGDRDDAVAIVGSDSIWVAYGRSSRTDDTITTHGWSVEAEFGLQYSESGGTDVSVWHAVRATSDVFMRLRLPGGEFSPDLRIVGTAADAWTHIVNGTIYNIGTSLASRSIAIPSGGLAGFRSLLMLATPLPITATNLGVTLAATMRDPTHQGDWGLDTEIDDVQRGGRIYNIIYDVNYGLAIGRIEDDDWRPNRDNDERQISNSIEIATKMSFRFKLTSTSSSAEDINSLRATAFKSESFVRMRLELFGR